MFTGQGPVPTNIFFHGVTVLFRPSPPPPNYSSLLPEAVPFLYPHNDLIKEQENTVQENRLEQRVALDISEV